MKVREQYLAFGTPDFTDEEVNAVTRVLRSGWVGMGAETLAFEAELVEFTGARHVVSVNSCTSALFLALLAEGVGPGDEVIVPSLTWCATANAALYLGAKPILCDVDPASFCATPETVAACITTRTKAVIVVHYGGLAIDMAQMRAAIPVHIAMIEDAAHAFGARYPDGKAVGTSGNSVCFSFYANKNLSTADGGAIALADSTKAERLQRLRMSGAASNAWMRYTSPSSALVGGIDELGYKMNLTDLQSALGRVQLRRQPEMAARRRAVAFRYRERFGTFPVPVPFQAHAFSEQHARHLLVARFDPAVTGIPRNELLLALRARNIGASIHYVPLHHMPLYREGVRQRLENTDILAREILTLPISARMTVEDADYVFGHLAEIVPNTVRFSP